MGTNYQTKLKDLGEALKSYWSINGQYTKSVETSSRSWSRKSSDSKKTITINNISLILALINLEEELNLEKIHTAEYPAHSEIDITWNRKLVSIVPFFNYFNYSDLENSILQKQKKGHIILVISAHPLTEQICLASARARENGFNLILASPSDIDYLASIKWTLKELIQYKLFRIYLEGGIDADAQFIEWEVERFREDIKFSPRYRYLLTLQQAIGLHKDKYNNLVTHPKLNKGISTVEKSKRVLFLGESASGKTTLALSIGELLQLKRIKVYYVDIGSLNSERAYKIGTMIFNLCVQSNEKICIILDDIQTQSGISRNILDFLGLLHKSIVGNNLLIMALSWPGYQEAIDNLNISFQTIFLEASDIAEKLVEKFGANLKTFEKQQIKEKAGDDLLLLRLWLELSNSQGDLVHDSLLASAVWEKRIGTKVRNLKSLKRSLLIASVLGMYEIETPIIFLKQYANVSDETIKYLIRRKLLTKRGENVFPPHRSFAKLIVEYLCQDSGIWQWFTENNKGIEKHNDILLRYFKGLNPHEIWGTLELINLAGGIKSTARSQSNVKMLINSWKQIDELKKKINQQIKEDPTWRNSLSSSTFACLGLASLGRFDEAEASLNFIRDNYKITKGKIFINIQRLSTMGDFEKILEKMLIEERDGTFPTGFHLETSEKLDIELFHENWASGIVLIAEASMNTLSVDELRKLALSVEKRMSSEGFFYPSRVPWCTARVLTGLGLCGRNVENSSAVKKATNWLLRERGAGGGREYKYWNPGTDGWNTPEETTAMCIIALRSVGIPSTNPVLIDAIEWLRNQTRIWSQAGYELDRAIAAEAYLSMNRNWEDIRSQILALATWANRIALWRNATLTAQKTYDQTCKVAQVGAFIINVMWQKLSEDLPKMLLALETSMDFSNGRNNSKKVEKKRNKIDVAITYASENRAFVKRVVKCLENAGINVFYDEFETEKIWGENIYDYFDDVYRKRAEYCVMFISSHYAKKAWTKHERQSAQARAFQENKAYILPIRFDDTEIPGISETVAYLDARKLTSTEICQMIIKKIN